MNTHTVSHTWTETVTGPDGEQTQRERSVTVVVAQATTRIGMRRSLLMEKQGEIFKVLVADEDRKWEPDELLAEQILFTSVYPSFIAATIEATGFDTWPISYEEFATLPEPLAIQWEAAVYGLNAHWVPDSPEVKALEETRKKVTSGSSE